MGTSLTLHHFLVTAGSKDTINRYCPRKPSSQCPTTTGRRQILYNLGDMSDPVRSRGESAQIRAMGGQRMDPRRSVHLFTATLRRRSGSIPSSHFSRMQPRRDSWDALRARHLILSHDRRFISSCFSIENRRSAPKGASHGNDHGRCTSMGAWRTVNDRTFIARDRFLGWGMSGLPRAQTQHGVMIRCAFAVCQQRI